MKVNIFGSISTGLVIESSDMDLVITGLNIKDRDDVVDRIKILTGFFRL